MLVFIGVESSGPDPVLHQVLELVVITTTDDFSLKSVSPSYVLYRPPGGPIAPDRYHQHTHNNLLSETALSHRKPFHVEDLLHDQFGRNNQTLKKSPVIYNSKEGYHLVRRQFPNFSDTLQGQVVFYTTYFDEEACSRFNLAGRALENLLIVISETKRLGRDRMFK